jgi:ATPase subunit of ABC transporter with duplicated ATPase domains
VSHDRYFLDRIASRVLELEDGKLIEHIGGYSDYIESKLR